jgi:hypothetical protein
VENRPRYFTVISNVVNATNNQPCGEAKHSSLKSGCITSSLAGV